MALKIVEAGTEILRGVARPLTPEEIRGAPIARLIEDMRDAMRAAPGVGLAAPQVGVGLALAVIEDAAAYHEGLDPNDLAARDRVAVPFHVIINPQLTIIDAGPAEFFEGCLSVPGYTALVARARSVRVDALSHDGRPVTIEARGWYARILQHEIDHLNGTLYVDRMQSRTFSTYASRAARPERAPGTRDGNTAGADAD